MLVPKRASEQANAGRALLRMSGIPIRVHCSALCVMGKLVDSNPPPPLLMPTPSPPSSPRRIAVIGAGFGGLSAAVHLCAAGHEVTVFEKNAEPGGKLHRVCDQGFTWDVGPSLLTMPHLLMELWEAAGRSLADDLELIRLPITCRYRWTDGTVIDEEAAFWQRPEVATFLKYAQGLYALSEEAFLRNPLTALPSQFKRENLERLRHFPALANPAVLDRVVRRYFTDPHLIQLFDRFATYNGSSPYRTPSAFNIIPYVQATFGGWTVRGGMQRIAVAVANLAEQMGACFRFGTQVEQLRQNAAGWEVQWGADGGQFDGVVCNQDTLSAYDSLLPHRMRKAFRRSHLKKRDLSMSGFAMLLGVGRKYAELSHHNILFSDDYPGEFHQLFKEGRPAAQPTIYVAVNSLTEPGLAPDGADNWFVLVNAPPNPEDELYWTPQRCQAYGSLVLERMAQFGFPGLQEAVRVRHDISPARFQSRSLAWRGALYGFASHGSLSAFQRPGMRPKGLRRFVFAGGTTHPGGGIPLVLLSGRIAARLLDEELRCP